MKPVRIAQPLYDKLKDRALINDRTIQAELNRLLQEVLK
jgi:hypothetical protein